MPSSCSCAKKTSSLSPDSTTQGDVDAVRNAGYTGGEIAEIIVQVVLNVFTQYFNNTTDVEVDFPKIALRRSA